MKATYLFCLLLLWGCAKNEKTEGSGIAGKWKRMETLRDPGNGSGQWQLVPQSEQTIIELKKDSTVQATGHWYLASYNRYEVVSDKEIKFRNSSGSTVTIIYELNEKLTLSYPCREACRDRFVRVN